MWTCLEIVFGRWFQSSWSGYQQFSSYESVAVAQSTHKHHPWFSNGSSIQKNPEAMALPIGPSQRKLQDATRIPPQVSLVLFSLSGRVVDLISEMYGIASVLLAISHLCVGRGGLKTPRPWSLAFLLSLSFGWYPPWMLSEQTHICVDS